MNNSYANHPGKAQVYLRQVDGIKAMLARLKYMYIRQADGITPILKHIYDRHSYAHHPGTGKAQAIREPTPTGAPEHSFVNRQLAEEHSVYNMQCAHTGEHAAMHDCGEQRDALHYPIATGRKFFNHRTKAL
jgi:hypothetical protein